MPKIPLKWLAESVDLVRGSTPEDVAVALASVGLEEEGIEGGGVTGPLVVGRVLSLVKEPQSNGKTINYCRVDVGSFNDPAGPGHAPDDGAEYVSSRGIVCGAHNFVEGDWVVVVLPGATLPGPFPISGRKTYGHWSDGMICSQRELGLGEDHAGIIVLTEIGFDANDLTPGQDAIALLGLDEATIEINVTPDRGYSFSIRGVAREYSHATAQEFRDPAAVPLTGAPGEGFEVSIEDAAPIRGKVGCDRFAARILRGFDPTAPSPTWMSRRLQQSGMRSVSLAVDVTNYVMLELGHPLHAYDLAKVTAPLVVRRASGNDKLTTLDGVDRGLDLEDILVCDSPLSANGGGHGARPIGLGGVMGGLETEVSETTTDILLEAAHWDPVTIARTARRHKLGSEASRRYERGVDTALAPVAIERALRLMQSQGGGVIEDVYTDLDNTVAPAAIQMDVDFPGQIVGVAYELDAVVASLEKVGCSVDRDGESLLVTPPTWRPDLEAPINLVEEVGRLHGYQNLPSVLPVAPPGRGYTHDQHVRSTVARTLAEWGLTEVLTYPFMSAARLDELQIPEGDIRRDVVRLANPISAEAPLLRTSIMATLVDALRVNLSRGAQDVAIYEVGRVYRASRIGSVPAHVDGLSITADEVKALDEALGDQPRRVAGIMTGAREAADWSGPAVPYIWADAVAAVERVASVVGVSLTVAPEQFAPFHPGRSAALFVGEDLIGVAGELHPKVLETLGLPARTVAFELVLDPLVRLTEGSIAAATPVAGHPLAKEDFAFVVSSDVPAGALVAALRAGHEFVEDVRVFDVYSGPQVGEGRKSVAVNVVMRAPDRTLSAEDVLAVRTALIAAADTEFGAVLR